MKRFLLFVFSILLTFTFAFAQDGINYQGAATDANGDELTNQNITIRASVLSTSANGNLEWEETHSTTTDQFGLFNVVIGQGTNTTNGAIASFDDMDWGSTGHYLKIEMDATGGTNYAMIGTTQMMSVPYALYAKSAGIDSTMLANMIGSSGGGMGGGCDFKFPDGLDGEVITISLNSGVSYTVPLGKRLYITAKHGNNIMNINGINIQTYGNDYSSPVIANAGDIVAPTYNPININGYLVDENYFANCGGGGSSTASAGLDSATVATMIANAVPNGTNVGQMLYWNGSVWDSIAPGSQGSVLTIGVNGIPVFEQPTLTVGMSYSGGIVGYIFTQGDPGYITGEVHGYTFYDSGIDLPWGCDGVATGINNTSLGAGPTNTSSLANTCTELNFAAKYCDDLVRNGYDDWFLPNYAERTKVPKDIIYTGGWLSTEAITGGCSYCIPAVVANSIYWNNNSNSWGIDWNYKSTTHRVIAFRQF